MKQLEIPTLGESPRTNPGQLGARASSVAVALAILISAATHQRPSPLSGLMAATFVVASFLCGLYALGSMVAYGPRRILIPALCGLSLSGLILAIAIPSFIAARPTSARLTETYELSPVPPGPIASPTQPYRIEAPGPRWAQRSAASARRDSPDADLWLVDPALDAHLIVLPETVDEGYEVDLTAFAEEIFERSRQKSQVGAMTPVQGRNTQGHQFEGHRPDGDPPIRFRLAVFAAGRHGVQLVCYGPPERFTSFSDACARAFQSFEFTDEAP